MNPREKLLPLFEFRCSVDSLVLDYFVVAGFHGLGYEHVLFASSQEQCHNLLHPAVFVHFFLLVIFDDVFGSLVEARTWNNHGATYVGDQPRCKL